MDVLFFWKFWCMTVNRNLVGAGCLTTDQKKKLLWGGKKSTPTEEVFYVFLFLAVFLPLHIAWHKRVFFFSGFDT